MCRLISDFSNIFLPLPSRIKESYLLHSGDPRGVGDLLARLSSDLLLDFEVRPASDPAELLRHVEAKCLPADLGGQADSDVEGWITLQVGYHRKRPLLYRYIHHCCFLNVCGPSLFFSLLLLQMSSLNDCSVLISQPISLA